MQRTLVPLVLIVLVLLGAWCIWPQAEPRALVGPQADATATAPAPPAASNAKVEVEAPVAERQAADEPALPTSTTTRLVVLCVSRSTQQPLAGVRVHAVEKSQKSWGYYGKGTAAHGKLGEELVSGPDGRVEFAVEPGLALKVDADDQEHFVSRERIDEIPALAAGETREVTLVHDAGEGAHFCGLVVARESGAPIANAEIKIEEKLRTSTDSAGRFELDFAAHLPPWIRVECKGFAAAIVSAEPGHEGMEHARRVLLDREASLVIALQVPEGQAALRVTLRGAGHDLVQDGSFTSAFRGIPDLKWSADADAERICRFEGLPPGVRLDAEVLGSTGVLFRSAHPIVLQPGEARHLEWDLRGCELVGHVYEADGKPASGIALWLLRGKHGYQSYEFGTQSNDAVGRATSMEDGRFRFVSVSPGTWILAPQSARLEPGAMPSDAIAPVPIEITLEAGEARHVVDIHLARGLYIRGTLVAPDGTSAVRGYVSARSESGAGVFVNTDAQGAFTLGPLAPGVFELTGGPYNTYLVSLPVQAEAGTKEVVLRSRPGAEVAGRVVDSSGAGVQAAITIGAESGSRTSTRTLLDGTFRLTGLEPGRYTVFASTSGGQAGEIAGVVLDTAVTVEGLEVVLRPGATLRVRNESGRYGQFTLRRGSAIICADGLEAGRSTTLVVASGKVSVEFRSPSVDAPEVQELEIGAGEEREVVFKAPAK